MKNTTIKQNANNIMWVEYWINKFQPSEEEYLFLAKKVGDNKWICEIKLPLVDKTVVASSSKEVNAMLNASEKAAKLINEYLKNHPDLPARNHFKRGHWEIVSDETGKVLSIGLNKDYKERLKSSLSKMQNESI